MGSWLSTFSYYSDLHTAVMNGCFGSVIYLLDEKNVDISSVDGDGRTALQIAILYDRFEIFKFLVKRGSSICNEDDFGQNAFHMAAAHPGNSKYLQLLLENILPHKKEETIHTKDNEGRTPLHFACKSGNMTSILLLSRYVPFDISERDDDGFTPLHIAVIYDRCEILELLVSSLGANLEDKTENRGWTALHIAAMKDHKKSLKILIRLGADLFARDNYNWDALQLASNDENRRFLRDAIDEYRKKVRIGGVPGLLPGLSPSR